VVDNVADRCFIILKNRYIRIKELVRVKWYCRNVIPCSAILLA